MIFVRSYRRYLLGLMLCCVVGCQESTEPPTPVDTAPAPVPAPQSVTEAVNTVAPPTEAAAPVAAPTPPSETKAEGIALDASKNPLRAERAPIEPPFEPPFGHRVELFVPPQAETGPVVERTTRSDDSQPEVVLKGFVNVGTARAVLLIDGKLAPLGAGQEKHGVRVLTLDPPQVTLERGRHRWTLSLAKATRPGARPQAAPRTGTVPVTELTPPAESKARPADD